MLRQVVDGVLTHQSAFMQTNAVVVRGSAGVLLIDAGVTDDELVCLANDVSQLGQPVVAGFSTHPHWDHLLWHAELGEGVPRYGTARCATTVRERLPDAAAKARIKAAGLIPADIVDQVPMDLLGVLTGLPADAERIPWDGPVVRIIEHQAHAVGHAALLVEERGVLVAGDMLSDILIPILDFNSSADPIENYLAALQLLENVAEDVEFFVPGHGSVGGRYELRARIEQDRAYLRALREGQEVTDPRISASAPYGTAMSEVHDGQARHLA